MVADPAWRDDVVFLGHARLSIIDLAGGQQPLCNEDGRCWITFNGEIFNYIELAEELGLRWCIRCGRDLHFFMPVHALYCSAACRSCQTISRPWRNPSPSLSSSR